MAALNPDERLKAVASPGRLWSYSSLSRFQECPYAWYGRYVLQIPDIPSMPLVRGILAHATLAAALKTGRAPEDWQAAVAAQRRQIPTAALVPRDQDALIASWLAAAWARRPAAAEAHTEAAWLAAVSALPGGHRPQLDVAPAEAILTSGQAFAWREAEAWLSRHGCDGVYVQPDWVGVSATTVTVVDWKTAAVKAGDTLASVAERYRAQLELYGYLARRRFQPRRVRAVVHLLPAGQAVDLDLSPSATVSLVRRMAETIWTIKAAANRGAKAFVKRVGPACQRCAVAQWPGACPEGTAYRRQQGWDRWDALERTRRQAAGVVWPGDAEDLPAVNPDG
jgi:hypothetical protein